MIAGFLFGLGLIAAFVIVANIQVIARIALVLIVAAVAVAAALGGVIYLVSNPEIIRNLGFGLLITAFLALIIAGMAVINNKLAARMAKARPMGHDWRVLRHSAGYYWTWFFSMVYRRRHSWALWLISLSGLVSDSASLPYILRML
jgi:heme/copper-type cytochrome/quinol oxidase subunit 2